MLARQSLFTSGRTKTGNGKYLGSSATITSRRRSERFRFATAAYLIFSGMVHLGRESKELMLLTCDLLPLDSAHT